MQKEETVKKPGRILARLLATELKGEALEAMRGGPPVSTTGSTSSDDHEDK